MRRQPAQGRGPQHRADRRARRGGALGVLTTTGTTLSPLTGRLRALTLGLIVLEVLIGFEALAVSTVMPAVAADLSGLPLYPLAFGAPLATSVVGMAVAGAWSDATASAVRPLVTGVVLFCAGLLTAGLAPSMPVLVGGRAVQGLGAGLLTVALYALVGSLVPEDVRPRVFAWLAAAWVLPSIAGPALAGLLVTVGGWRVVFLAVPVLAVPALLVLLSAMRGAGEPAPAPEGPRPGVRTRVLLATAAGLGAAALQVVGTRGEPVWRIVAALALVAVLACSVRLLPAGTFRLGRGVPAVIAVRALVGAAFAGAGAFVPLLLVREHGWAPGYAGLTLTAAAFAWSATAWIQGRMSEHMRFVTAVLGTALVAGGIAVALTGALAGVPGAVTVAGWCVVGGGMGFVYSSTSVLVLALSPQERHGEASSALTTGEALASSVVLALAGAAFTALLPPGVSSTGPAGSAPYLAGIGIALLAGAVSVAGAARMNPSRG